MINKVQTRGEVIIEYKQAFETGTEGMRLLETLKKINTLNCSDASKALCLRQEIDSMICGYMDSRKVK